MSENPFTDFDVLGLDVFIESQDNYHRSRNFNRNHPYVTASRREYFWSGVTLGLRLMVTGVIFIAVASEFSRLASR